MKCIKHFFLALFVGGLYVSNSFAAKAVSDSSPLGDGAPGKPDASVEAFKEEIEIIPAEISIKFPKLIEKLNEKLKKIINKDLVDNMFNDHRLEVYGYPFVRTGTIEERRERLKRIKAEYKENVLSKQSVLTGHAFASSYQRLFSKLKREKGVNAHSLVAVMRVESNFGMNLGDRSVLNNLYSLYLISERKSRKKFAANQIACFLRISEKQGWDPFSVKGSWAGAFGNTQFIPCTYEKYAVDGNGDGIINLFTPEDAFASTANLLHAMGWRKNPRLALWRYNHWDFYVDLTFLYKDAVHKHIAEQQRLLVLKQ